MRGQKGEIKKKIYRTNKIVLWILAAACIAFFLIWQNNDITITRINYINEKVPAGFSGFKVAHISDLHNKKFGNKQERLLKNVNDSDPDIIVVTGDLIDRRHYDLEAALTFIKGAVEIAPVYFVSGNHEGWSGDYDNISRRLSELGVKVLDNEKVELKRGDDKIEILGSPDPAVYMNTNDGEINALGSSRGDDDFYDSSVFQILLFHRPEYFELFADKNIDLVFSGHAHGGQVRIPFAGGLVAPGQGFSPKYTSGMYTLKDSAMVVSRGLGNSIIPVRIFNRPEVVVVTLQKKVSN